MTILIITALLLFPPASDGMRGGDVSLSLDPGRYPMKGDPDAPVIVVEFSDFKCHACEKFNLTIMPDLEKRFIEPGQLKVAFVDFPLLDQDHYTTVAESVHCAGQQDRYWQMHDTIWENIGALSDLHLMGYAEKMGLEMGDFGACLDEDRYRPRVLDDLEFTYGLGLSSRPTFFIGRRAAESGPHAYTGRFIKGTQNHLVYRSVIRRMLSDSAGR